MTDINEYKTLHDLIHRLPRNDILNECTEVDPDNIEGYEDVLNNLVRLEPQPSTMVIVINYINEDDGYDIGGLGTDGEIYGIEFTPWGEWLGMEFTTRNCDISLARVAALCLNEMIFIGWSDEQVQQEREDLMAAAAETIKQFDKE